MKKEIRFTHPTTKELSQLSGIVLHIKLAAVRHSLYDFFDSVQIVDRLGVEVGERKSTAGFLVDRHLRKYVRGCWLILPTSPIVARGVENIAEVKMLAVEDGLKTIEEIRGAALSRGWIRHVQPDKFGQPLLTVAASRLSSAIEGTAQRKEFRIGRFVEVGENLLGNKVAGLVSDGAEILCVFQPHYFFAHFENPTFACQVCMTFTDGEIEPFGEAPDNIAAPYEIYWRTAGGWNVVCL